MNLEPVDDRVIVVKEVMKETAGGIQIPQVAQASTNFGTVLAVGPGQKLTSGGRSDMFLKVGDKVVFAKRTGIVVEVGGKEYLSVREGEIIARIKEK